MSAQYFISIQEMVINIRANMTFHAYFSFIQDGTSSYLYSRGYKETYAVEFPSGPIVPPPQRQQAS